MRSGVFLLVMAAFVLAWASEATAAGTVRVEAEGHSCMGDDKSRRQTEQEAIASARRDAAERAGSHVKSDTVVSSLNLEKDVVSISASAEVSVVETLESSWYKDPSAGDCHRVRIMVEVASSDRGADGKADHRRQIEQKGVKYNEESFLASVREGNAEMVDLFISAGVNLNARVKPSHENRGGETALMIAINRKDAAMAESLISAGADPDLADNYGNTALVYAVDLDQPGMASSLVASGADVKKASGALPIAARKGDMGTVRLFLDGGVGVESKNGQKALIEAAEKGHPDIVGLLLDRGANIGVRDFAEYTPLIRAAEYGRLDTVILLLDRGADVNAADKFGFTSLIRASGKGHLEVVSVLIKKGADMNLRTDYGETALVRAIKDREPEVAALLINSGADPSIADKNGRTALYWARNKKLEKIVEALHGAGQ